MQTVERVIINASPAAIWQVLTDVERWPTWTPTTLKVEPLTSNGHKDGLKVGTRYRVIQPKLRPAVYEVTECTPHEAFTWIQKAPGATMIADHRLSPHSSGVEVELSFSTEGLLGALLGSMYSKRIADYIRTEARSLKSHCESLQAANTKVS
jgi:uncharacterized protein YndB with AHSA1/START domain